MIEIMRAFIAEANASPELWDEIAKAYRNMYDALVRNGFTKEDALTIVKTQGIKLSA